MSLYLLLNLGSLSIPFLYSFHPKLKLYEKWKFIFPAILFTSVYFIFWDVIFTQDGVWGFNAMYHSSLEFFGLPLEEWLFFICIPYACVFTHYALLFYFPDTKLSTKFTRYLSIILAFILLILAFIFNEKAYTFVNFIVGAIWLLVANKYHQKLLRQFFLTFIVMIIPFLIVNGILTGSFIANEVVWYNNNENLGIRVFTIPVEDFVYAFSLILSCLFLSQKLEGLFTKRAKLSPAV